MSMNKYTRHPVFPVPRVLCSTPTRWEGYRRFSSWSEGRHTHTKKKTELPGWFRWLVDSPDLHLVGTRQDGLRRPLCELGGVVL